MNRRSKISCCIVGCHNRYSNTEGNIKFYRFPGKAYEVERRKNWINSIKRKSSTGESWTPKKDDRICSAHFIGNEKSNDSRNPSYIPSRFPKEYKMPTENEESKLNRFERFKNRESTSATTSSTVQVQEFASEMFPELPMEDFSCQANFDEDFKEEDCFLFECHFEKASNNIGTTAYIPNNQPFKRTGDKCVGNSDHIECDGFHGFNSVKSNENLNSLCGLSFERFKLLLTFITFHGNDKLSIENKLLLLLIKIKTGLSFSILGILFNVHKTTASKIFITILTELTSKVNNVIFWPSREVVDATMPEAFKTHYPKCRVIIDCTEILIEQPKNIDNRIYTYSHYKGNFTAKFLIGISPNGFISFISKCYGGQSSDTYITKRSGLLDLLEPNDVILADKGFPGIRCLNDTVIVMPPFVHGGMLTIEEVEETDNIANVRIHVERCIQRNKVHKILQKIPNTLFPYLDRIVKMCCILTNFQPHIIKQNDEFEED